MGEGLRPETIVTFRPVSSHFPVFVASTNYDDYWGFYRPDRHPINAIRVDRPSVVRQLRQNHKMLAHDGKALKPLCNPVHSAPQLARAMAFALYNLQHGASVLA